MARHYSPKAFMIEAPNRLLKDYYERAGQNVPLPVAVEVCGDAVDEQL